jgi:catechol 2,3-dioxygenase-like lactoylglutathione lyase family enzyme
MLAVAQERLARGIRVGSIVIRCTRFDEMRVFWQAALGYVPREAPQDGWVVLTDPTGTGPNLSLERVDTPIAPAPDELSAIHLDLYTDDQPGDVERLVALGATRYPHEAPDGADFVVLVDPDGYRFCVVQK